MPDSQNRRLDPPKSWQEALLRIWGTRFRYLLLFPIAPAVALLVLWQTLPETAKDKVIESVSSFLIDRTQRADVEVELFSIAEPSDQQAVWLKNKVERNLVEYLCAFGLRVSHKLSVAGSPPNATHHIKGSISRLGDLYSVEVLLVRDSIVVASGGLDGDFTFLTRIYKSIPEALIYDMDVDFKTLAPLHSKKRPTESSAAYATYLQAKQLATFGYVDDAIKPVLCAIRPVGQSPSRSNLARWRSRKNSRGRS